LLVFNRLTRNGQVLKNADALLRPTSGAEPTLPFFFNGTTNELILYSDFAGGENRKA
jgi:hypothetical protein